MNAQIPPKSKRGRAWQEGATGSRTLSSDTQNPHQGGKPTPSSAPRTLPHNTCSPNPSQCQRERRKSEAGFGGVLLLINSPFQAFSHRGRRGRKEINECLGLPLTSPGKGPGRWILCSVPSVRPAEPASRRRGQDIPHSRRI